MHGAGVVYRGESGADDGEGVGGSAWEEGGGVSRLEATAQCAEAQAPFVAACYDAQRGQMFAAMYRRKNGGLERVEEEMVIEAAVS